MFNEAVKQKSLVIVYDEKSKAYATHMMQLLGQSDDTEDDIVGIKDGNVKSVMWSEQAYKDNEMEITSDQKVLFIGRSKITKQNNENTMKKFSKYGITYGWLGNRAVLTVNKKISLSDYKKFAEEAEITVKKIENKQTTTKKDGIKAGVTTASIFGVKAFAPLVAVSSIPLLSAGLLFPLVLKGKKEMDFQKKAREQRFKFAVLKLYNDDLKEFIGD